MLTKKFALILGLAAIIFFGLTLLSKQKHAYQSSEQTFAIIKPEAVAAGNAPGLPSIMIKDHGFTIVAEKQITFDQAAAEKFYAVHNNKPFFGVLSKIYYFGWVIALVLAKENAVKAWRDLMGATNPEKAEAGTIRKLYGKDIQHNAVHGSDSLKTKN